MRSERHVLRFPRSVSHEVGYLDGHRARVRVLYRELRDEVRPAGALREVVLLRARRGAYDVVASGPDPLVVEVLWPLGDYLLTVGADYRCAEVMGRVVADPQRVRGVYRSARMGCHAKALRDYCAVTLHVGQLDDRVIVSGVLNREVSIEVGPARPFREIERRRRGGCPHRVGPACPDTLVVEIHRALDYDLHFVEGLDLGAEVVSGIVRAAQGAHRIDGGPGVLWNSHSNDCVLAIPSHVGQPDVCRLGARVLDSEVSLKIRPGR